MIRINACRLAGCGQAVGCAADGCVQERAAHANSRAIPSRVCGAAPAVTVDCHRGVCAGACGGNVVSPANIAAHKGKGAGVAKDVGAGSSQGRVDCHPDCCIRAVDPRGSRCPRSAVYSCGVTHTVHTQTL